MEAAMGATEATAGATAMATATASKHKQKMECYKLSKLSHVYLKIQQFD
jgi:hypothetical protein